VLFVNFCLVFLLCLFPLKCSFCIMIQQIAQVRGTSKNTLEGYTETETTMANSSEIRLNFSSHKEKSLVLPDYLPLLWSLKSF
jgi:hypothetical protein